MKDITIGSLFSGIGGLELGLEQATGARTIWQAEMNPYACAVLEKHWPKVKRYNDVKEVNETTERPTIICGGFPCQDISNAGKREGIIEGQRSSLWFEYARIIRVLRPEFVFVENVAALLGRGLETVLGSLAEIGYDATWDLFRASDVGAPHKRERIFILAHAEGAGLQARAGDHLGVKPSRQPLRTAAHHGSESDVADAEGQRLHGTWTSRHGGNGPQDVGTHRFPPGPRDISSWAGAQPSVRRGSDGLLTRVDRLRCLGNAVVPQVATIAWQTLTARIGLNVEG